MALALARKYRPRKFSDLLVQDHVASVLRGAVVKNRVGHGYLLTGPRGVGKTTAARILAMALNCERKGTTSPAGEPCGECESCQRVWTGGAGLDVVEIDAASNRGVDDARELRERAMYAASREGHHKVYIVDEAHMLTREAWNALLKILEEPPPGVVFVFATTEPQKIAQTAAPVLSRLQRFDFRRIGATAIRERLTAVLAAEQIEADEDALTLIARQADGGMRDALSVLDQCLSFGEGKVTAQRVRDILGLVDDEVYSELIGLLVRQEPAGVFALVDRLEDAGADLIEFLGQAGEVLRAMLMLKLGTRPEGLTEALRQALERQLDQLEAGDLLRMLKVLAETEPSLRRTGNPRLGVETLLLRWTMMDRTVNLAQALSGTGGASAPSGGGRPSGEASRFTPPPAEPPAPRSPAPSPRFSAPQPGTAEAPAPAPAPAATPRPAAQPRRIVGEFTLEALLAAWPDLTQVAREQSRFLGEAINAARPVGISGAEVKLALPDGNPIHLEALGHQRSAVERLLTEAAGRPISIAITQGGPDAPSPAPRTRRLSESEARAERLKVLKTRDPALEAAAESLDLEVLE
ncbi:MAG: DNA polymerase III subunit gamma/tau [Gemmatimonadales bacterium]